MSDFRRLVYDVVVTVPCGEVRSYKWVAERVGKPRAARAVGQALKRNPAPFKVPCHRIVRSDGTTGGYRFGTELKRELIKGEKECERDCPLKSKAK